jgi:hypothetical protein
MQADAHRGLLTLDLDPENSVVVWVKKWVVVM